MRVNKGSGDLSTENADPWRRIVAMRMAHRETHKLFVLWSAIARNASRSQRPLVCFESQRFLFTVA